MPTKNKSFSDWSKQNSGKVSFSDWSTSKKVDDEYINSFVNDANSLFGKQAFEKDDYNTWSQLDQRATNIKNWVKINKSKLNGDSYKAVIDYLDAYDQASKRYSQWETEDDYNEYLKGQEQRTQMLSYDTEKGASDLSNLDRQIAAIENTLEQKQSYYNSRYGSNGNNGTSTYNPYGTTNNGPYSNPGTVYVANAASDRDRARTAQEIADLQKQLNELKTQRTQKGTYHNTAKNLQNSVAFTDTATNADDFEQYSAKGENNTITETKNKYTTTDSFGEDVTLTREQRFAKYLTEDELDVYEYYIGKGDTESAEAYLNSMEDTVNARKGLEIFDLVKDKTALELVFGAAAGLDQFKTGIVTTVTAPFSDKNHYSPSAIQQASGLIREDLSDAGFKIGSNSIGQIGYDLITTTSNMLPSILISTGVGAIAEKFIPGSGEFVGEAVGSVLLGASAAGNAYAEMINLGYTKSQAGTYSAMIGASEAGLQLVMGGIGKLGGFATKGATQKIIGSLDNALAKGAIKFGDAFVDVAKNTITYGGKMISEGLEEYLQEVLDPFYKNIAFNEKNEVKLYTPEALYSGVLGALSAGILDVVPSSIRDTVNTAKTYSLGKSIQNTDTGVERLKELGQTFSADSVAYKIANRVDENTGAYTVGKLLNEVGAEITQQNQNDIIDALVEKGVAPRNAKTITTWLSKVVDGVNLTKKQQIALEENEVISQVFQDVIVNKNSTVNQRRQSYFEAIESYGYTGIDPDAEIEATRTAYNRKLASNEEISKNMMSQSSTAQRLRTASDPNFDAHISKVADEVREKTNTEKLFQPQYHEVSAEGKTILTINNTFEDVEIKSVALTKGKEMTLELSDGRKVNSKDISYRSSDEAIVYETVANMSVPTEVANTLIKNYSPTQSGGVYALGIEEAYRYGYHNYSLNELMSRASFAKELTATQRISAYNLGKAMGKADFNTTKKGTKSYSKGRVIFEGDRSQLTSRQKTSLEAIEKISSLTGLQIRIFESDVVKGRRVGKNGSYNPTTGEMEIDLFAGADGQGVMLHTASHELVHHIRQWSAEKYKILADFLMEQYGKKGVSVDELVHRQIEKAEASGRTLSYAEAHEEVIADSMESMLTDGKVLEKLQMLQTKDKSLFEKIKSAITELVNKIKKAYKNVKPETLEGQIVASMLDEIETIQQLFVDAIADATENFKNAEVIESVGLSLDNETESVHEVLSERTWTASEYVTHRKESAELISKTLGVSKKKALAYIDAVNSIAKMIANDRTRLDYDASVGSPFVSNVEYGGSFDFTTLCKKRRLFTGTFSAIQKRLGDVALTPDDILKIRNMMLSRNLEATCGLCYVEGSRANMGKFAKKFIELYKRDNPDAWVPEMYDVNTPDGVESMKRMHPECYEQYEYFWNHYGKLKDSDPALFASQQKPKLYEARHEYNGEIRKLFAKDSNVEKKNRNGGIRLQSFSDFEIVHLIDTMQIIMDMSTVGLAGQAYTKVPEFANAFGNTGLKINLSLIAKGVDENGKLIFDDVEGMPHQTAFDLRNKYSKNVGTIIVAFTDEQITAAMADPRIDFIIPFHRSQWKKGQYGAMGLPSGTKDYTYMQNEKLIKTTYHEYRGRMVKDKAANYMPNEYWDFSKSGKENAENYLKLCAENNKRPKFYKLLDTDGKGNYFLKKDGSTDGYWKLLIDFKMYDNNGVGSPQTSVVPDFSMAESMQMLEEYRGGHSSYPIAHEVVDEFVNQYKKDHKSVSEDDVKYSDRYSELHDMNVRINELREQRKAIIASEEYNKVVEETMRSDDTDKAMKSYFAFLESSGLKKVDKELATLEKKAVELRDVLNKETESELSNEREKAIAESGLSEAEYDRKQAIKEFGYTPYYYDAGYILDNGKMLNFSGEKGKHFGTRGEDHRGISRIFNGTLEGTASMVKFMNEGNIRIMDETPGLDISVMPTKEQFTAIRKYINSKKGEVAVDISDADGRNISSVFYNKGTSADWIILDIKEYFEKGKIPEQEDVRYSARDYSYDALVSKPDMKVTTLYDFDQHDRKDVVKEAKKNATSVGKANSDGSVSVYVNDIDREVIVSTKAIRHSLDSRSKVNIPVVLKIGEILKNSIKINELNPREENISQSYVLMGMAKNPNNEPYIVSFVVNSYTNTIDTVDVLYSANAKKEPAGIISPRVSTPSTGSAISIRLLLDFVNKYFSDILPEDVLRHYGHVSRPDGKLGESALFSDRDPDALTPRNLLANALEESAVHEVEKKKLAEYKANIEKLYANEQELYEVRKEIKELSFAPGKKDTAKIKKLQEKAIKLSNSVTFYDKKLLNLESTTFLKNVLEREKQKAIKRQKEKDAERLKAQKEKALQKEKEITERYQASRKKAVESRNKTAMRNKIKRVVNELNQYLLHGTKDKHVMDNMKKVVAEALNIIDMDTVGADERVERYNQLIAEATDPDVIASLTETRDRIQGQGNRLHEKLMSLKNAYADIINSTDPVIANAYDEVIENKILSVAQSIEGTSIRNMSLSQLEEVYDLYKMVLTNIRDSNKAFKAGKDETIAELGYKVNSEVENVTTQKYKISMFKDYISKFGWNELKPIYAFRMIGSDTFQRLFKNILRGQDTWYRDVAEGRTFQQEVKKKHGYNKWDFKKTYTFTAKSGKNFDLTLQQIMSLYAFSRREQALEHLVQGGIVFDRDVKITEKVKGIPVSYKVNTTDAFSLSPEIIGEIIDSLTPEQKSFVNEMQSFLSDVMGEKGNEVSLEMYGIKLFKEKFYFPLKSSEYYMNFTADEAGEVKLKNSGFSKETVKHANNPIVLSDFMDVWSKHVNEMSTYHAFVLPIEDFSRVYNYRTPSSETSTTTSLKNTLNNAFGSGVNKYIRQMLVDINGGARSGLESPTDKITSLAKKGAVTMSASVVIQQPSAIARAMAYIKPKYFFTVESFKFAKHNKKWQELKKYAPVAGIKEMGYFDTGMGRSSADWIVEEDYDNIREKLYAFFHDKDARKTLTDDFLGKAPSMADELSWVAMWEAVKKETKKETEGLDPNSEEFLERCGERFTEVVELTQVYDSVLSRSGYMRDKGSFMKMATSFMAEPTVQANMLIDACIQGKRNGKVGVRFASGVISSVIASIVLNTLLKSIVYAARDDDEEKTYWEKYFGAVVGDLTQSLNPLTMIPFAKDIVSIFSGYDVERMDMSLVADLKDSIMDIGSDTKTTPDKILGLIGSIGQLVGVPAKNVIRDTKAVINTVDSLSKGNKTTKLGLEYALKDEANYTVTGNLLNKVFGISFDTSDQKKYYDAIMSGDTAYAERIYSSFTNPQNSIVSALKKYEPRILEAAQAEIDGKPNERYRIAKEIVADGFKQDYVIRAIQSAISTLTKKESSSTEKQYSMSDISNYFDSAQKGDTTSAKKHMDAIIETDMQNYGKTYEEAEKSFFNKFNNAVREAIENNSISVEKASEMLVQFGNLDAESANEKAQYYAFKRDYTELDHNWSESNVTKYYAVAEPADISVDVFDHYLVGIADCKGIDSNGDGKADSGTVKAEKLELIDSLPLSNYQKDVLYRMNGWAESKLWEAPWH